MPALGGPLSFPGDAGGQVSRPKLPSAPVKVSGESLASLPQKASDSVDYDFRTIPLAAGRSRLRAYVRRTSSEMGSQGGLFILFRRAVALLSSPRSPSNTTRIFSSAEKCRRVARRMSLIASSAGCFSGPDFCLIFAPCGSFATFCVCLEQ
jgi:hypothetical protein